MMARIAAGIVLIAATATAADWIWYTFGVQHTAWAGVIHGAVLLTVVGGVLGAAAGRLLRGLPIGALAGVGGALAYYAFVLLIDSRPYGAAIPAAWVVTWLILAVCEGRWMRVAAPRSLLEIALRGTAAAVLSGVAFYFVLNTLWGAPPEGGRSYLLQFLAWAFAWGPGMLALTAGSLAPGSKRGATSPPG
jgi:hypothetical protein